MAVTDSQPVSAGNLRAVVQKLTGGAGSIADLVYPVGAIYLSTSSTSPQTLFGGTWRRIQGRFLLCAGGGYAAGSTGGEASHTLTVDEMPAHAHSATIPTGRIMVNTQSTRYTYAAEPGSIQTETTSTGGNAAHNNMPPYLAVYAWKRTA